MEGGEPPEVVPDSPAPGMARRDFLRRSGLGAGALAVGGAGGLGGVLTACGDGGGAPGTFRRSGPEVVVVGAGTFGGWTALHLQELGARVTLLDLYGPGNSRSTSGDETRGIRTAYGDREMWTEWARRCIDRWKAFDEEWVPILGEPPLYYESGDLILRDEWGPFLQETKDTWDKLGIAHEVLDMDEVRRRWPQIATPGLEAALYEPVAGVGRARAACQRVAEVFRRRGGAIQISGAVPGERAGGRLRTVTLDGGEALGADAFVFALGPWLPKAFPDIMGQRIRIPMGNVFYYGTPPGDHRFSHPNLPSWGIAGATGWASLPKDERGFRVRTGGRTGNDPDTSERWVPEEYLEQPRSILADFFPALADAPLLETRACHYEFSVTRDWFIDRHPDLGNAWIAGGGSAEAFKFGPMLGELVAGRVLETDRFPELTDSFRIREEDLAPPSPPGD